MSEPATLTTLREMLAAHEAQHSRLTKAHSSGVVSHLGALLQIIERNAIQTDALRTAIHAVTVVTECIEEQPDNPAAAYWRVAFKQANARFKTEREMRLSTERREHNLFSKLVFELVDRTRAEGQWTPGTERWAREVAGMAAAQAAPDEPEAPASGQEYPPSCLPTKAELAREITAEVVGNTLRIGSTRKYGAGLRCGAGGPRSAPTEPMAGEPPTPPEEH